MSEAEAADAAVSDVMRRQRALHVPTRLRGTSPSRDKFPAIIKHVMKDRALYFAQARPSAIRLSCGSSRRQGSHIRDQLVRLRL